jgi:ATP-dependent DNA helicase RecQ
MASGSGRSDEAGWRAVLRQLLTLRLVEVDHENWNVLRLAEASRDVLAGRRRLTLRRDVARAAPARTRTRRTGSLAAAIAAGPGSPREERLFQSLREWRRQVAHEHGVPAYTVLHDASLREIAQARPQSTVQLGGISGIGATKLARYGVAIIDVVAAAAED